MSILFNKNLEKHPYKQGIKGVGKDFWFDLIFSQINICDSHKS